MFGKEFHGVVSEPGMERVELALSGIVDPHLIEPFGDFGSAARSSYAGNDHDSQRKQATQEHERLRPGGK